MAAEIKKRNPRQTLSSLSSSAMAGTSTSTFPTTTKDSLLRGIENRFHSLLSECSSINETEGSLLPSECISLALFETYKLLNKCYGERSSINEERSKEREDNARNIGRHLCVSDGYMIICLDLKHKKIDDLNDWSDKLQPLPKSPTLVLVDAGFPVSMGLLKLKSQVYMVGGYKFPKTHSQNLLDYQEDTLKGSLDTYELSLRADGSLSLSISDRLGPLLKPKFWAIVEEVGNQIHVFESLPPDCYYPHHPFPPLDIILPSHEVVNPCNLDDCWVDLSPVCESSHFPVHHPLYRSDLYHQHTWSSLVVGDLVYATRDHDTFEVFDSKTNKWELREYSYFTPSLFAIRHVSELLIFGFGRCIGKFVGVYLGEEPLYVVIALGAEKGYGKMAAAAYLVTEHGQILFYQRLPGVFGGFMGCIECLAGTVINVDEDGKSLCAVVRGITGGVRKHLLFISTFTLGEISYARWMAPELMLQKNLQLLPTEDLPLAAEMDFVDIVVKDWHAYELGEGDLLKDPCRLSACFL